MSYGKVTERLAKDANRASQGAIDITDNYLELVSYDIGHAYEQHIKAKEEGDIDLSLDDLKNIPDYVDEYDEVVCAIQYSSGTTRICLSKKVADGRVLIIETVSKSRGALQFKNMIGVTEEKYISDYINVYKKRSSTNARGGRIPNISLRDESTSEGIIRHDNEKSKLSGGNSTAVTEAEQFSYSLRGNTDLQISVLFCKTIPPGFASLNPAPFTQGRLVATVFKLNYPQPVRAGGMSY